MSSFFFLFRLLHCPLEMSSNRGLPCLCFFFSFDNICTLHNTNVGHEIAVYMPDINRQLYQLCFFYKFYDICPVFRLNVGLPLEDRREYFLHKQLLYNTTWECNIVLDIVFEKRQYLWHYDAHIRIDIVGRERERERSTLPSITWKKRPYCRKYCTTWDWQHTMHNHFRWLRQREWEKVSKWKMLNNSDNRQYNFNSTNSVAFLDFMFQSMFIIGNHFVVLHRLDFVVLLI